MSSITRRDALKTGAIAGTLAAAAVIAGSASGAEPKAPPAGDWGASGDKAFKLTDGKNPLKIDGKVGLFGDNCNDVKQGISGRFAVYEFGSCDHPTPIDADAEAAVLVARVIANGGILNTEFGHKTVTHRAGPITYHTYLAYAAGDKV